MAVECGPERLSEGGFLKVESEDGPAIAGLAERYNSFFLSRGAMHRRSCDLVALLLLDSYSRGFSFCAKG